MKNITVPRLTQIQEAFPVKHKIIRNSWALQSPLKDQSQVHSSVDRASKSHHTDNFIITEFSNQLLCYVGGQVNKTKTLKKSLLSSYFGEVR